MKKTNAPHLIPIGVDGSKPNEFALTKRPKNFINAGISVVGVDAPPALSRDGAGGYFSKNKIGNPLMKKILLGLLTFLILGCGDGSSSGDGPVTSTTTSATALPNTEATMQAVRDASPLKSCPHSQYFLASNSVTWRIVNGYSFSILDTIQVREDCTFESFTCGTLGYLISGGENFGTGIVHVMMLGHLFPKAGCYALGEQSCAYAQDGAGELRLSCQLINPIDGWTP